MRRAGAGKRRDGNESLLVIALRAAGASVEYLSGPGVPDLLVGYRGRNYLFEVKTARGKLKPGQKLWIEKWRGDVPFTVRDIEEIFRVLGIAAPRKTA